MEKTLILNELKRYLKLKTDTDFAIYLGITPQTLSNWKSRNTPQKKSGYLCSRTLTINLTKPKPMKVKSRPNYKLNFTSSNTLGKKYKLLITSFVKNRIFIVKYFEISISF